MLSLWNGKTYGTVIKLIGYMFPEEFQELCIRTNRVRAREVGEEFITRYEHVLRVGW
jgi:hypothetical protein